MTDSLFDLRSQLRFYKFYHHNLVNVLIHSVFVPTILFTSICMLHRVGLPFEFMGTPVTLAHLLGLGFGLFYIMLFIPTGLLASGIIAGALYMLDKGKIELGLKREFGVFVLAWIFQFIGHGVFEKKKPALFDNLVQSLVLAPYFILFELLFLLGMFPMLKNNLNADVAKMEQEARKKN
ncbi:hypothetical protein RNJ44_02600 [Nakaseomyces bracarensis]|uniref:DUF962 domain-containing protein n=1 Tax=Nakaseomyces bracarensis TaxID=273131 RepID=A0ABR4NZP5_9SACH